VALTPLRPGTFVFSRNRFCGDGHEDMTGELVVEP
jgi:heme/copper-type cytochrome/quinol oxidase subunit 2